MARTWFVYIIECCDGSLYTGITVDLVARFEAHRAGRGARYMRLHPPRRMLAAEACADRSAASRAEYRIKQLTPTRQARLGAAHPLMATGMIVFSHANSFGAATYGRLFDGWRAAGHEVAAVEHFGHDAQFPSTVAGRA
jgi:putative endonuclease